MRTSLPPSDAVSTCTRDPWLEVRRGRTRAPRRDIRGRRFLIGGGSNCQLQLGGNDVPILHSVLLVEEDGAHIDSLAPAPQLLVNGRPQRSADLHDGDVFSIGKFEFQVHVPQPTGALQASGDTAPPIPDNLDELGQYSAAELVALIEAEFGQVDQIESGQTFGAAALLDAVRRTAASRDDLPGSAPVAPESTTKPEVVFSFQTATTSGDKPADEQAA